MQSSYMGKANVALQQPRQVADRRCQIRTTKQYRQPVARLLKDNRELTCKTSVDDGTNIPPGGKDAVGAKQAPNPSQCRRTLKPMPGLCAYDSIECPARSSIVFEVIDHHVDLALTTRSELARHLLIWFEGRYPQAKTKQRTRCDPRASANVENRASTRNAIGEHLKERIRIARAHSIIRRRSQPELSSKAGHRITLAQQRLLG